LDPALLFRVLVVAPGHEPRFFPKVDPRRGPLEAELNPRSVTNLPPSHLLLGRVVDEEGNGVENAVVSLDSLRQGDTTHGSPPEGTDPLAITDERGDFFLSSKEGFEAMNLEVEARRFARKKFNGLSGGTKRHTLKVTVGAALTGRVLKDGKGLEGVALGVVSQDRGIENFTGDFVIGTMDDGRFLFSNLPPGRDYYVYGIMSSLTNHGALPAQLVRLGADGTTKELGELKLVPGVKLAGHVKLSDGAPLPPHTRVSLSSEEAWDVLAVELGAEGRFALEHLPPGTHNVSARVPGYRIAGANASFDASNPFRLLGQLKTDKTNLTLLLEPGEDLRSEYSSNPTGERPRDLPLAGIEQKRRIPNPRTLTGRVTDAETGRPLNQFRVLPGRRSSPTSPQTEWQYSRMLAQSNGVYALEVSRQGGTVLLQVEADDYLPAVSASLSADAAGWDFQLKKCWTPSGVLLTPEGKPAQGAQIIYIGEGEQAGLRMSGELSSYHLRPGSEARTDAQGRFGFAPKLGEGELVAVSTEGWRRFTLPELKAQTNVTLQGWTRVVGRLIRNGQGAAREHVDLQSPAIWDGRRPWMNYHGTITDEAGRFVIEHVPPGTWHLSTRVPSGGASWSNTRQHEFKAAPGETVDVGTIQQKSP
jgi:hypothetical protein